VQYPSEIIYKINLIVNNDCDDIVLNKRNDHIVCIYIYWLLFFSRCSLFNLNLNLNWLIELKMSLNFKKKENPSVAIETKS